MSYVVGIFQGGSRPGYFKTGSTQDTRTSVDSTPTTVSQALLVATASANLFAPGDVGKYIKFATSEVALITGFVNPTQVNVTPSQTVAATTILLQGFTMGGDFGNISAANAHGVLGGSESIAGNIDNHMFWYDLPNSDFRDLGGNGSQPAKINSDGKMLYVTNAGGITARIYDPVSNTSSDQGNIGGGATTPTTMNESLQVAMDCNTLHDDATSWVKACRGFAGVVTVIHPAEAHKIGAPDNNQDGDSFTVDINESGHVCGYYLDPNDGYFQKPFYFNGTTTAPITVPAGADARPLAMNDNDVVVGFYNGDQPFAWALGILTPIPLLPGMTAGKGSNVNNLNWVVGSMDNGGPQHGFIYRLGVTEDLLTIAAGLDPLWLAIFTATFANDGKQIVGFGNYGGVIKAYRLTLA